MQTPSEILIYNGFPFHYEMIGFILDFCNKNKIIATVINRTINDEWLELYKQKYVFNSLPELPSCDNLKRFIFVLVLTDDDPTFPESYINNNNNIVCIDHMNINRRPSIKCHIPISAFEPSATNYALPIFDFIDYETKMNKLSQHNKPIITIIGDSSFPYHKDSLSIINNLHEFDVIIINRRIPKECLSYLELFNIYLFENISAIRMFELLALSNYVCYIPNNTENSISQYNNRAISASIPISFTTGCKLILPKKMNEFLQLDSVVEYSFDSPFTLDTNPTLVKTFIERNRLLQIRDNTLRATQLRIMERTGDVA